MQGGDIRCEETAEENRSGNHAQSDARIEHVVPLKKFLFHFVFYKLIICVVVSVILKIFIYVNIFCLKLSFRTVDCMTAADILFKHLLSCLDFNISLGRDTPFFELIEPIGFESLIKAGNFFYSLGWYAVINGFNT